MKSDVATLNFNVRVGSRIVTVAKGMRVGIASVASRCPIRRHLLIDYVVARSPETKWRNFMTNVLKKLGFF
jgi:hypothetical protein